MPLAEIVDSLEPVLLELNDELPVVLVISVPPVEFVVVVVSVQPVVAVPDELQIVSVEAVE